MKRRERAAEFLRRTKNGAVSAPVQSVGVALKLQSQRGEKEIPHPMLHRGARAGHSGEGRNARKGIYAKLRTRGRNAQEVKRGEDSLCIPRCLACHPHRPEGEICSRVHVRAEGLEGQPSAPVGGERIGRGSEHLPARENDVRGRKGWRGVCLAPHATGAMLLVARSGLGAWGWEPHSASLRRALPLRQHQAEYVHPKSVERTLCVSRRELSLKLLQLAVDCEDSLSAALGLTLAQEEDERRAREK